MVREWRFILRSVVPMYALPRTSESELWEIVLNHEKFAREVLGRWFKHQKFTSFVRQLNMYGFHKIPHLQQGVLRSDTDTEPWHFEHPHFHRGQPDLLCLIQRKKQPAQGGGEDVHMDINEPAHVPPPISNLTAGQVLDINTVVNGISAIKRHQQAISAELNELKTSNQHLWQEAIAARERHKRHQDTINRILKFLAGVFGRNGDNEDKHESHSGPSPHAVIPRKRQRLMIEDGSNSDKGKTTMVEEIDDDDDSRRKSFESSPGSRRYSSGRSTTVRSRGVVLITFHPGQYARIQTPGSSVRGQSVGPPEPFSPTTPEVSNEYYQQPLRPSEIISRSSTAEPPNTNSNSGSSNTPTPSNQNVVNVSTVPPPSNTIAPSFPSNTSQVDASSQVWGPAISQLLTSPTQFQRILQALQQNYPVVPPPTMASFPIQANGMDLQPSAPPLSQQVTTYDPNAYDFSRLRTDLPSGQGIVDNPSTSTSLSLLGQEDDGPSLEPLVQNAQQLHKSYRDAEDISADVDELQYNINSLIESLGLDPATLAPPPAVDHEDPVQSSITPGIQPLQPPSFGLTNGSMSTSSILPPVHPSTAGGGPPSSTVPDSDIPTIDPNVVDFDFDAFLNELDTRNPGEHNSDYPTRFDGVTSQIVDETNRTEPLPAFLDEVPCSNPPVSPPSVGTGGRKRKSSVADLPIPIITPPEIATPTSSPKVKRKR